MQDKLGNLCRDPPVTPGYQQGKGKAGALYPSSCVCSDGVIWFSRGGSSAGMQENSTEKDLYYSAEIGTWDLRAPEALSKFKGSQI